MKAILVIETDTKHIEDLYVEHIWNDCYLVELGKEVHFKPMPKFKINEKRVEFLNMTEREKHFYELGHDDASDEFYEEIEK